MCLLLNYEVKKKKKIIKNYLQNVGVFRIGIKENKSQGHVLQFHHVIAFHPFKSVIEVWPDEHICSARVGHRPLSFKDRLDCPLCSSCSHLRHSLKCCSLILADHPLEEKWTWKDCSCFLFFFVISKKLQKYLQIIFAIKIVIICMFFFFFMHQGTF